jgi:hypothetical protein
MSYLVIGIIFLLPEEYPVVFLSGRPGGDELFWFLFV